MKNNLNANLGRLNTRFILKHFLLLLAICATVQTSIFAQSEKVFPPFYVHKLSMGDKVVNFSFKDLNGKAWTNQRFLRKPLVMITGSWKLRHDLRKWADYLSLNHILEVDILWIFNPCSTVFANKKNMSVSAFENFKTSVPVIIDDHSLIGRSFKIDYDIPTIIGIDRLNRFQFCHSSPFNKMGLEVVHNLIKSRL